MFESPCIPSGVLRAYGGHSRHYGRAAGDYGAAPIRGCADREPAVRKSVRDGRSV